MKTILIVIFFLYSQVQSVEPDEILADQELENYLGDQTLGEPISTDIIKEKEIDQ